MKTINGVYTSATIFTANNGANAIEDYALKQIQLLCDHEAMNGCRIRIMPDVHPRTVGTIGLTMTIANKLMPNLIGIDIGCGMTLAQIKKIKFQQLDTVIRNQIPSGFSIQNKPHRFADDFDFTRLHCSHHVNRAKALLSLGTLGEGNHFIEMDKNTDGNLYCVIHSGNRHLGKEVTEYYLKEGQKLLKEKGILVSYELAKGMKWKLLDNYSCIHNYVDTTPQTLECFHAPLLRKGAISAKSNEKVIIPINMRDGIILGTGLGNSDWNCSAPHGAGRILKREAVKDSYTVSAFKAEMKGIYSSCINKETLDEAPFAYRRLEDIAEVIQDTVKIGQILKPVYNFKGGK